MSGRVSIAIVAHDNAAQVAELLASFKSVYGDEGKLKIGTTGTGDERQADGKRHRPR